MTSAQIPGLDYNNAYCDQSHHVLQDYVNPRCKERVDRSIQEEWEKEKPTNPCLLSCHVEGWELPNEH